VPVPDKGEIQAKDEVITLTASTLRVPLAFSDVG
jgi:hypothetical protein